MPVLCINVKQQYNTKLHDITYVSEDQELKTLINLATIESHKLFPVI